MLTHQGRSSSSGHYVGWVRQKGDTWMKFDDDVVSPVTTDDILRLSGGGWLSGFAKVANSINSFRFSLRWLALRLCSLVWPKTLECASYWRGNDGGSSHRLDPGLMLVDCLKCTFFETKADCILHGRERGACGQLIALNIFSLFNLILTFDWMKIKKKWNTKQIFEFALAKYQHLQQICL